MRRASFVAAFALATAWSPLAAAKQTVIDDFEGAGSPSPWVFSSGPEFPGATGSLASGPGATGKGAALSYDFSGGGSYVAMTLTLPTASTTSSRGTPCPPRSIPRKRPSTHRPAPAISPAASA